MDLLHTMEGGSIGLAGPRGVGKTTIMRTLCDERSWQLHGRPVLSIMTPAPSQYDARDFILHLFFVVCRRLCKLNGLDVDDVVWSSGFRNRTTSSQTAALFRHLYRFHFSLRLIGSILIFLGIVSAIVAVYGPTGLMIGTISSIASALKITPGLLLLSGILLILIQFALRMLIYYRRVHLNNNDPRSESDIDNILTRTPSSLVKRALHWMQAIKFQQSYTSGWSGALKFPIGIEGGIKSDTSVAERPLTLPEIVSGFRDFLRMLGQEYWVIIGIDELDKIHPEDAAERFLNEIKVIFGVERIYYLLSVSENALSSFERRGFPLRNTFDSCFDEIIHVKVSFAEGSQYNFAPTHHRDALPIHVPLLLHLRWTTSRPDQNVS